MEEILKENHPTDESWKKLEQELRLNLETCHNLEKLLPFIEKFLVCHPKIYHRFLALDLIEIPAGVDDVIITILQNIRNIPSLILIDICSVYSKDHFQRVQSIMEANVVQSELEAVIKNAIRLVDEKFSSSQKRVEKSRSSNAFTLFDDIEGFPLILDAVWSLASVIDQVPTVATAILEYPSFLKSHCSYYMSVLSTESLNESIMFIKITFLYLIYAVLSKALTNCLTGENASRFYDLMMELLNIQNRGDQILINAHVLADLEYVFCLTGDFECLKQVLPDAQLEYLQISIKHLIENSFLTAAGIPRRYKESRIRSEPQNKLRDLVLDRRNVFDGDQFDLFRRDDVDMSRIHLGKRDFEIELDDKEDLSEIKEKIIHYSLHNNDNEDEDGEVGEDYDVASDPLVKQDKNLIEAYIEDVSVFERSQKARNSAKRLALKTKTGLVDEQIEGWKIMFDRHPKKNDILFWAEMNAIKNRPVTPQPAQSQQSSARGRGRGRGGSGRSRGKSRGGNWSRGGGSFRGGGGGGGGRR